MDLNYKRSIGLINFLLFLVVTCCYSDCPANFLRLQSKCYYFSRDKQTWIDAYFNCRDIKANLVVVANKNQDQRLKHYLWKEYLEPKEWWIGASYDWKQKVWLWSASGDKVKYNQFVGYKGDLQWNCATIDTNLDYKWNSKQCVNQLNYICQRKLEKNITDDDYANNVPIVAPFDPKERPEEVNYQNMQPGYILPRPVHRKSKIDPSKPKMVCPKGYRHVRGMCYRFSKGMVTWQDAYYTCDSEYNGTLAIIMNKMEDKALRKASARLGVPKFDRWIGGRYDWEDMAWKWATNGAVIQHQRNNRDELRWHCLVWSPYFKNKWVSDNCVNKKHFVCQTKMTLPIRFPENYGQKYLKTFN